MYVGYGQETMVARTQMTPMMPALSVRPVAPPSSTYLGPSPQPAPPVLVDQVFVEDEQPPPANGEGDQTGSMLLWGGIVLLAVLGGGAVYMYTRKKR